MPRNASELSTERLKELARSGAQELLNKLRAEIVAIERTFPELALPRRRRTAAKSVRTARKRARTMSAEARKAVSERMRKYWAERRKAQARTKANKSSSAAKGTRAAS
jgi:hypothetical protein